MDDPIQVTAGGVDWLVRPECREQLLGPNGLRLDEWVRNGLAQVVKHGPHRTVYRVGLPGLDIYIKHYRLMDVRAWLRELVRPAKAWLEYRRALAVASRRVPTVVPLAVGRRRFGMGPGESFLITQSLDGTEAVSSFLEHSLALLPCHQQTPLRQQLALELGRFIARLHHSGVVHHDLHAGNLLLRREMDDRLTLFLIDLHAIHLGRPLSGRERRANLILLNRYFSMRASRTDRLRFWKAYCQSVERSTEYSVLRIPYRDLARDLERGTWASNLHFWQQRDGRCLDSNRYYQRLRSTMAHGHAVNDLDPALCDALLADPDAPFRQPGVKVLKDSPSATVVEIAAVVGGVSQPVIYKRIRATRWFDPYTSLVRQPAALRSWVNGHGLRERALPTPRPLLVLHRHRHGLLYDGYLLMEKVVDAVDLHQFAQRLRSLPLTERRTLLRRCIDQVASLIRELHRRQLSHRDLKATNILIQLLSPLAPGGRGVGGEGAAAAVIPCGNPSPQPLSPQGRGAPEAKSEVPFQVSLIDLVGVVRYRTLPESRKVQNLARLHVSFCHQPLLTRTDKLRFLRRYQQWGLFGRHDWKEWWRQIALATEVKIARNRRSGRPLG